MVEGSRCRLVIIVERGQGGCCMCVCGGGGGGGEGEREGGDE